MHPTRTSPRPPTPAPGLRWAVFGCLLAGLPAGCGTERAGQESTAAAPAGAGSAAPDAGLIPPVPSAESGEGEDRCPADGLRVSVAPVDAAMGLRATSILLTNCGQQPHPLTGYPRLRLLDEQGEPLDVEFAQGSAGIAVLEGMDAPPRPVTLAPGESAEAPLLWRNTVTEGTAVTGAVLEVTPAEGLAPHRVRPQGGVDVGTTGLVGFGAWRPRGGGAEPREDPRREERRGGGRQREAPDEDGMRPGAAGGRFDPWAGPTERPGPG